MHRIKVKISGGTGDNTSFELFYSLYESPDEQEIEGAYRIIGEFVEGVLLGVLSALVTDSLLKVEQSIKSASLLLTELNSVCQEQLGSPLIKVISL